MIIIYVLKILKSQLKFLMFKKNQTYFFKKVNLFFVIFLIGSIQSTFCQIGENSSTTHLFLDEISNSIDADFYKYNELISKHEILQKQLSDSLNYYTKISKLDYVLTGSDIDYLNTTFSNRIALLFESVEFANLEVTRTKNEQFYYLISTHLKIKALQSFLLQQKVINGNSKINNLINEENLLYRNEKKSLKKIKRILISNRFRKSILNSWNTSLSYENVQEQTEIRAILNEIESTSYFQNYIATKENIKKSKKYFRKLIDKKTTFYAEVNFNNFLNNILSGLSNVISNFMGIFSLRKGKLINNEAFIYNSLLQLQPLDVILEKTPFKLTDKFIPGYWGHAAIYVGNETQLKELGVWNNFFVAKYHNEIKEGKVIVEALRSKVACNTLKHFSNIDDYAQLRLVEELTLDQKREMIERVFAQIGKKYDFGYNVESSKKMICSELHYITFDEVEFNTSTFMGTNTVSVDQIAEQGLIGGAFFPIDLYLDGIRIEDKKMVEIYCQLPKASRKEIKQLKKSLQH